MVFQCSQSDSIKGPVINAKEQRNTRRADISILELTSLEAAKVSVCPVRHFATYLRSSSNKRNSKSGDSVFIHADGTPLEVDDININSFKVSYQCFQDLGYL
ncbi:hypothetical protein ACTFIU_009072 [Dictyostelium citrinum]